jgi:hypothetical protein
MVFRGTVHSLRGITHLILNRFWGRWLAEPGRAGRPGGGILPPCKPNQPNAWLRLAFPCHAGQAQRSVCHKSFIKLQS